MKLRKRKPLKLHQVETPHSVSLVRMSRWPLGSNGTPFNLRLARWLQTVIFLFFMIQSKFITKVIVFTCYLQVPTGLQAVQSWFWLCRLRRNQPTCHALHYFQSVRLRNKHNNWRQQRSRYLLSLFHFQTSRSIGK